MEYEPIRFNDKIYSNDDFINYILDNYDIGDSRYYRNVEINKQITEIAGFKLNDLIVAYRKGFFEIVGFDCRLDLTLEGIKCLHIIVEYENKFTPTGVIKKGKYIHNCDISYVKPAKLYIENEKQRLCKIINNLNIILED